MSNALQRPGTMLLVAAMMAFGMVAPVRGQELDRSKRPVAPPAPAFHFPHTHTQVLPNGLRVIVVEDHALPLVTVRVVVGADSLNDPPGKEGLFAMTSAMLREGTTTMSADEQSSAFAALGNSVTPFRFTTITANVDRSLALMSDMLEHPAFPQDALDRRKAMLVAIEQRRSEAFATRPYQILLNELLGANDPMARSFIPSEASIRSISRTDVLDFYGAHFHPATTTVVVVGDVEATDAAAEVAKRFGDWAGGASSEPPAPRAVAPRATTIYLLDQPGAKQTQIAVGTLGPPRDSRDAAAFDVMSYVLGNGAASRISRNLRERHSFMYSGVPMAVTWRPDPRVSLIAGLVPVNPAKGDSALIEWLSEIRRMRDDQPTPQEMAVARGALVGILPAQVETIDRIGDRLTYLVANRLPVNYYDDYVKQISRVTPREVSAVAAKYLRPAHLVIVVSGERETLEPLLRAARLGAVVIVNP